MNRFVLFLLAAVAAASVASAAPTICPAPVPSDVSNAGFSTYDCGGLTFSDFHVVNAGDQATAKVNIGQSFYEDDSAGVRTVTLALNPNLDLATLGESADVWLWYTVNSSAGAIDHIGGTMPQVGSYTESVCSGAFYPNVGCKPGQTVATFTVNHAINGGNFLPGAPVNGTQFFIFKDIGAWAPVHNTAMTQVFTLPGPFVDFPPQSVPAPGTILMMGTGLLAAGMLGRGARKA